MSVIKWSSLRASWRGVVFGIAAVMSTASVSLAAIAPLSSEDKAQVEQVETYLNGITSLKAHFLQVNPDGQAVEGTVFLARPGRLRLDYDPPSPILVVTNGNMLVYYDKQLEQVSYVDVDSTPAGVLIKPQIKLDDGDLQVVKVVEAKATLNVTVTHRKDPGQGAITLVFSQQPFQLRQWKVLDQQGQITTVSLFNAQSGLSFDKELFHFHDPKMDVRPELNSNDR